MRLALLGGLAAAGCLVGCSSYGSSEDRSLSSFAQRVQRHLETATDPRDASRNESSTRELVQLVEDLHQQRASLQAKLASGPKEDHTRERIEIVRIDRQLELIDRLLMRYEQNAPVVASGD